MRRFRRVALVVCGLAAAGLACAPFAEPQAANRAARPASRLQEILARGELRVATTADLPPLSMRDGDGKITGFEIELVQALAEAMNLRIRIVETPFSELLDTVERGEVDLAISGLTMTPARNARVAFAGPYFISGTSLLVRDPETLDAVEWGDPGALDDPSRSVAALAGSTSASFVRTRLPKARLVLTPDYESAVELLLAGEVDAVVADLLACRRAEWRHRDEGLRALRTPFTTEPLGIALPADDPLLLNLVENYLRTIRDTGELTVLKARWLSEGAGLDPLP